MPMQNSTNLREFVLRRNEEQSGAYRSPGQRLARALYRAAHPTEISALKCMDGRLNFALITKTPPGVIQPFRNIGGRFDLGWPFFQDSLRGWVEYSISRARRPLILVTYHFSKGSERRGCAGWNDDTDAARAAAFALAKQIESVFGTSPRIVYPVVVGIETDEDALVIHGTKTYDIAAQTSINGLEETLSDLFPDMDHTMIADFLPLLQGNWEHVCEIRASKRPVADLDHHEQIIAVGRGFDWLHLPNKALIIGPYAHDWPDAVVMAGKIVANNLVADRIPKEAGALLLVSALTRDEEGSFGWKMAEEKTKYLRCVSRRILSKNVPQLSSVLDIVAGVTSSGYTVFPSVGRLIAILLIVRQNTGIR